ncbi:hypothetical protein SAMN02982990_03549 [Photorhabdus luminescens]|uniref:Uncharacterized protein n=1 Tax=Photorhabdus luminescens TaxID=29488 RepID=A0A1G5RA40_PHOLU|nr:hypothetical protein SAMN02982990_03549 [Photorhabdus luminescens]
MSAGFYIIRGTSINLMWDVTGFEMGTVSIEGLHPHWTFAQQYYQKTAGKTSLSLKR